MQKRGQQDGLGRKMTMPYVTSEMASIMRHVEHQVGDPSLVQSLHFSPTALALVRRVMMSGGSIITDTTLALNGIDEGMVRKLNVQLKCYIDDPIVMNTATQRHITRAEIALDYALTLPGMKMLVIGSAPMALSRLLQRKAGEAMNDLVVLAMPTGFASVIQLKERLWDSDIPCIVMRGKKGGAAISVAVVNALMMESIKEQNL